MERVVEFDITAKYDLGNSDNDDVNKLFGWGYFGGGHQQDSVRFGWNWNNDESKVRLFSYYYLNGQRTFKLVCEVPLNKKFLLKIEMKQGKYWWTVTDVRQDYIVYGIDHVDYAHNKTWSYRLGAFFGGNKTCDHDITIKISKK